MRTIALRRHPSSGRGRLVGAMINSGLVGAFTIAALLVSELLVRHVAPQQLIIPQPQLYRPDELVGWRHRENVRTIINTGEGEVHFRTDANGYRIPWDAVVGEAQPGTRVLLLGDSFLESTAVEAEHTMPELLERRLSALLGKSVKVDNTGVGGWNPNHYLLEARSALAKQPYALGIVFLYIGNDIVVNRVESFQPRQESQLHRFRVPRSLAWKEWIDAVLYPINDRLETRSHLYVLTKVRLEVPLARLGLTAYYFPEVFAVRERDSRRWDTSTAICIAIQREFAARGAPVLFVLLPTPYQVDPTLFDKYVKSFSIRRDAVDLEQPNRMLGTRFRESSLTVLDPLPEMRRIHNQGVRLYGKVDRHLNANGHRVVTELLLRSVAPALQPPRARRGPPGLSVDPRT